MSELASKAVIVACFQDPPALEDLRKLLTAAGISFTVRDESITDEDPKTGYPRAFDIFWVEVGSSQASDASEIAQSKRTPVSGGPVCPRCLSSSVRVEWFIRWFLPVLLTRSLNGHPNLPGLKRKCLECNYTWARFNRPSM